MVLVGHAHGTLPLSRAGRVPGLAGHRPTGAAARHRGEHHYTIALGLALGLDSGTNPRPGPGPGPSPNPKPQTPNPKPQTPNPVSAPAPTSPPNSDLNPNQVDICSDGKIVDHAAYYDHASVVRQMQPAKGETDAPALGRLSPSDSGLQPKPGEREAQELMGQLYASKVLSMLDNCCHGVGLGVCVAAEELRVAACSSDFALPLGFADKHSALGSGLIAHLRSRAVPFAAALALALAHALTSASVTSALTSTLTVALTSPPCPCPRPRRPHHHRSHH